MVDNCIFCQIIKKEISAEIVFEDEQSLAIIDLYPASAGHLLIVPKEHKQSIKDFSQDLIAHLGKISQRLSSIFFQNMKVEGVTSIIQEGKFAGQKSPHQIMHLIPRFENDGLNFNIEDIELSKTDFEDFFKSWIEWK